MTGAPSDPLPGLDDPARRWLQTLIRVRSHPEWGVARVARWYPASPSAPARVRIIADSVAKPQIVDVAEIEAVSS